MITTPAFDSKQKRVVALPENARAFITAGPGAGKTYTLVARARRLIDEKGFSPSDLLVLSFTNAVITELRRRDREQGPSSAFLPETFDAFASRLLAAHNVGGDWRIAGYDQRIRAATQLIRDGAASEWLERVRHILVDEVQDLVGPRAELVEALLQAHRAGFTAFGDPAQAIYDHEQPDGGRTLIRTLVAGLASVMQDLPHNHRASVDWAPVIEHTRDQLLSGNELAGIEATEGALLSVDTVGNFEDVAAFVAMMAGNRAVLCRDNATALLVSRELYRGGLEHRVRRGTGERPVAGWVARLFDGNTRLVRDQLPARLESLRGTYKWELPDEARAWRTLARLDPGSRGGAIRASEVGARIAVGRVPYELYEEAPHPLVVSSVHRAKGLEFDRCVIVDWTRAGADDISLEARVLFVALSRSSRACLHAGPRRVRDAPWFRSSQADGRLIKRGFKKWQTFGIEIRGDDVHAADPSGSIGIEEEPRNVQVRLAQEVAPGDLVTLEYLDQLSFASEMLPVYAVRHPSGMLGVTGAQFGGVMRRRLGDSMPRSVGEVRVDGIETVKGAVESAAAAGLGAAGLWLRPRLVGLGEFVWSRDER